MKNTFIYKSFFYNKSGNNIEPFYIIHKSESINQANINAKNYYIGYISNSNKGSIQKNILYKNFIVKTIRLNKL